MKTELKPEKDIELHEDEFVLPYKWCVRREKTNDSVARYFNKRFDVAFLEHGCDNSLIGCNEVTKTHKWFYVEEFDKNYTEITIEEFKKYVVKENKMETTTEKEIIGYRLVKPQYETAACKIAGTLNLKSIPSGICISKNSEATICLKEAGVLDLWFEPVYEENQFKAGDWVYVRGTGSGNGITDKDFAVVKLLNVKERTHGGNIDADFAFRYKSSIYGIRKEYILRKATPEEIKAATERYVDLSNGKTVLVTTDKILAAGKRIQYKHIKNLYCNQYTFGDTGWNIYYNSFDIGCWKNITRADLKLILDAYDEINQD